MERLTKTYDDGTHAAADSLPCGENSWNYKELLLNKLGAYEDTGLRPCEILALSDKLKYASEQWDIWYDAYQKDVSVWIPVEERLPEHDGLYLVCMDDEFIASVEYTTNRDGNQDWELWDESGEVVAWMPLPEPYKPEN